MDKIAALFNKLAEWYWQQLPTPLPEDCLTFKNNYGGLVHVTIDDGAYVVKREAEDGTESHMN